jgi:hypothetical protein
VTRASLGRRLWGTLRLHADAYEEVEADPRSIGQAILVVALASLAGGAGTALRLSGAGAPPRGVAFQTAVSMLLPPLVWIGGSAFAYMTGATFFRTHATQTDFREVLRTTGFAFGAGPLLAAQALPPAWLGVSVSWLGVLWTLAGGVVAIRQALDFTTLRALATFGSAAVLLWVLVWGLVVVPLPF